MFILEVPDNKQVKSISEFPAKYMPKRHYNDVAFGLKEAGFKLHVTRWVPKLMQTVSS